MRLYCSIKGSLPGAEPGGSSTVIDLDEIIEISLDCRIRSEEERSDVDDDPQNYRIVISYRAGHFTSMTCISREEAEDIHARIVRAWAGQHTIMGRMPDHLKGNP